MVSKALKAYPWIEEKILYTGQHYSAEMSKDLFAELDFKPLYQLGIKFSSLSGPSAVCSPFLGAPAVQVATMMGGIAEYLCVLKPDILLNYGDTNSALAASLAGAKLGIPIAHVESGLRSWDRSQPEELNRIVCDHLSTWRFVPSKAGMANLAREGLDPLRSYEVGDVMRDSVIEHAESALKRNTLIKYSLSPGEYILLTLHRPENTNDRIALEAVFNALADLKPRVKVVFPVHPRTSALITPGLKRLAGSRNWEITPPVGYHDMLCLTGFAKLVVTDSGGVQREAAYLGTKCVCLRPVTEWVELAVAGHVVCVSPARGKAVILKALEKALVKRKTPPPPYGDGRAAEEIAKVLSLALSGG